MNMLCAALQLDGTCVDICGDTRQTCSVKYHAIQPVGTHKEQRWGKLVEVVAGKDGILLLEWQIPSAQDMAESKAMVSHRW